MSTLFPDRPDLTPPTKPTRGGASIPTSKLDGFIRQLSAKSAVAFTVAQLAEMAGCDEVAAERACESAMGAGRLKRVGSIPGRGTQYTSAAREVGGRK